MVCLLELKLKEIASPLYSLHASMVRKHKKKKLLDHVVIDANGLID
jgi:hypothetical protein